MKYIKIEGLIATVVLSRGQMAVIDAADVGLVESFSWSVIPSPVGFYARSSKGVYMHRLITSCPKGKEVDHLNHNTLDNRRENLKVGSHKENMANGKFALTIVCPKGHAYNTKNTYLNKSGKRICRACNAIRVAEIYANETPQEREIRRLKVKVYSETNKAKLAAKNAIYRESRKAEKATYDRIRRAKMRSN
jgi:hypothetical protein